MKEKCIGFGLYNKEVREVLIKNDAKLETCPFIGTFSISKELNNNIDTSNSGTTKATFARHKYTVS